MFPFRTKKSEQPTFMTPEFKQYLELHGLLVDIQLGQSLIQQRLDRMNEQIAELQRNETHHTRVIEPLPRISRYRYDGLADDEFEAQERRYSAQDFQELMDIPVTQEEIAQGIADARAKFEAYKARQSLTTITSPASGGYPWQKDCSLKEARRLLALQYPEYCTPAIGIDPLELLKKDWMADAKANPLKEEGTCS